MIGRTLAHYHIVEKIGAGGMGDVYRARDTRLDRDVALKVLPPDCAADPQRRQRFEREARSVAALKHPNIVTIHSVERVEEVDFLTMELVEGRTLSQVLPAGGLPLEAFLQIAVPLADAVSCAHAKGMTHRDLKPDNVMIDGDGRLKVLDFGLAKLCGPQVLQPDETTPVQAELTQAGVLLGTIAYMSPEQIRGGEIDARSDVFSLGIIFYELLTGARPFGGDSLPAIMYGIVNDAAPPLPVELGAVVDVVDRCLQKQPGDRFANAGGVRQALGSPLTTTLAAESRIDTALLPIDDARDVAVPSMASTAEIQAAVERGDWQAAYRELCAIRDRRELDAAELEILAACVVWLGDFDGGIPWLEAAHAAWVKSGDHTAAARTALDLVALHVEMLAGTVARGWQRRAERLLRDQPECIEHGHLLRRQTVTALERREFDRALELNQQCAEIADRLDDRDLQTVALHDRGQILIARGDVEEGTALVDEAMTAAVGGGLSPETIGSLYCRTMTVCQSLADFNRAREWSEAATRWCQPYSQSGFLGICRIHSASALRHQGRWQEAEQAVRKACDEFEANRINSHAGAAYYELGEMALRKGDYQEAEAAFKRAHELGLDPVPGLPLLRLAQGQGESARRSIRRALGETVEDRLRRAKLLIAAINIELAIGDVDAAQQNVDELADISQSFGSATFEAHAMIGRGAIELERGNPQAASRALREAWSKFNDTGVPYEAARARVFLARAYQAAGDVDDARMQVEAAIKTFTELGAKVDLETASRFVGELNSA